MPDRSLVLYAWQQARDDQGKVWESGEILSSITKATPVPIFGMSVHSVGRGIIGGHVYTVEAAAGKVAEVVRRIANGERAQDIPVQNVPTVPMFDWRELARWGMREPLAARQYRAFQRSDFLGAIQVAHRRCINAHRSAKRVNCGAARREKTPAARQASTRPGEEARRNLAAIVESSDDAILSKTLDGKITTWNPGAERIYGYTTSEIVGRNVSTLAPADVRKK